MPRPASSLRQQIRSILRRNLKRHWSVSGREPPFMERFFAHTRGFHASGSMWKNRRYRRNSRREHHHQLNSREKRRRAALGEDESTDFLERGSPSHLQLSPVLRNSPKQPFDTNYSLFHANTSQREMWRKFRSAQNILGWCSDAPNPNLNRNLNLNLFRASKIKSGFLIFEIRRISFHIWAARQRPSQN